MRPAQAIYKEKLRGGAAMNGAAQSVERGGR